MIINDVSLLLFVCLKILSEFKNKYKFKNSNNISIQTYKPQGFLILL